MAKVTKLEILVSVSLDTLKNEFFNQYNSLSYVPELFDMIEEMTLKEWLIHQFTRDFTVKELMEIFEYEE